MCSPNLQGVSQDELAIEAILLIVCHLQENVFYMVFSKEISIPKSFSLSV